VPPAMAKRQATVQKALDNGWDPELKTEGRDDINDLPIPPSGKAYARLSGGIPALKRKQGQYIRLMRDLADPGVPIVGFTNRDQGQKSRKEALELVRILLDDQDVRKPLERSHVERTQFGGGKWPSGISPGGKTTGKFKFPRNFKVGHAIKM
jgi:hypothetical protein